MQTLLMGNADSSKQSPFIWVGFMSLASEKEKLSLQSENTCGYSRWRLGMEKAQRTGEAKD